MQKRVPENAESVHKLFFGRVLKAARGAKRAVAEKRQVMFALHAWLIRGSELLKMELATAANPAGNIINSDPLIRLNNVLRRAAFRHAHAENCSAPP